MSLCGPSGCCHLCSITPNDVFFLCFTTMFCKVRHDLTRQCSLVVVVVVVAVGYIYLVHVCSRNDPMSFACSVSAADLCNSVTSNPDIAVCIIVRCGVF